jgi:hypothetical protein
MNYLNGQSTLISVNLNVIRHILNVDSPKVKLLLITFYITDNKCIYHPSNLNLAPKITSSELPFEQSFRLEISTKGYS